MHPWERDADLPPLLPVHGPVRRVCVVGAIGVEKGFDVLLACVRDARARALPIEFVVVGYTADDTRLMDAGPAFVTGEYAEADAVALIRAQEAQVVFIPSVWPETWCFALSRAWQAGLAAVAFDLGAQAERIRTTGRGWLLPLGLPGRAVNDALLALPVALGGR
ncbi:MAG: glycosyltransferase [Gemmatimonadaceae bacterium]|nr:glycosyltransferase [Acetobacteraceae bacterium]